MAKTGVKCSKCKSYHCTRSGFRWVRGERRQRYQCQNCGQYFVPGARRADRPQ